MVADDSIASFLMGIRGISYLIVDDRVGFRQLEQDLNNGRFDWKEVRRVLVLLGRAEVCDGKDLVRCALQFIAALRRSGCQAVLTITGPLAHSGDRRLLLHEFICSTYKLSAAVADLPLTVFSDFAIKCSQDQLQQGLLIDEMGLTNSGRCKFKSCLFG